MNTQQHYPEQREKKCKSVDLSLAHRDTPKAEGGEGGHPPDESEWVSERERIMIIIIIIITEKSNHLHNNNNPVTIAASLRWKNHSDDDDDDAAAASSSSSSSVAAAAGARRQRGRDHLGPKSHQKTGRNRKRVNERRTISHSGTFQIDVVTKRSSEGGEEWGQGGEGGRRDSAKAERWKEGRAEQSSGV